LIIKILFILVSPQNYLKQDENDDELWEIYNKTLTKNNSIKSRAKFFA